MYEAADRKISVEVRASKWQTRSNKFNLAQALNKRMNNEEPLGKVELLPTEVDKVRARKQRRR